MTTFSQLIRSAGVVGAGGAGFPTYIKAGAKAGQVLMNAAECEPLLAKDIELLNHFQDEILEGFSALVDNTGATEGLIGIKRKHADTVANLTKAVKKYPKIKVAPMGDFYPAGDEYCLVYELTGRVIPAGGIPLDVGVVVCNVETCLNIARAAKTPVTHTFVTVTGAVKKPATFHVPVGARFSDLLRAAGGVTVSEPAYIDGGPMMGRVFFDADAPIVKTTSGLIVLPKSHPLIYKKAAGYAAYSRMGKSACDQCSFCTMLCPRNLLGYNVEPHKVMRTLLFSDAGGRAAASESALLCCECSLCSLYSCPEGLDPRNMCVTAKQELRAKGIGVKNSPVVKGKSFGVHPLREYRKTPVSSLVKKLGLADYKKHAPLTELPFEIKNARLMLAQHIGVPAAPLVAAGDRVRAGQKIADVPADKLGVAVHASINGTVTKVTELYIELQA
ncbi:MAG: 4Fe-4S dicluster domain-containing protein [Elusimicrobiaceae bacterium]